MKPLNTKLVHAACVVFLIQAGLGILALLFMIALPVLGLMLGGGFAP